MKDAPHEAPLDGPGLPKPRVVRQRVADEMSVFLKAVEIDPPDERAAFVAEECGGDAGLREAVSRLLREHDREEHPLDRPVVDAANAATLIVPTQDVGETIGPYRLREKIGEGGFGLVFVADQLRPVRRRVALKVIRPGMDTGEATARFEAERQALAMMDHPNIARVFDAGVTEGGQHYFAMELVRGLALTEFCDHNRLDVRGRLDLFVAICNAVQHAHQKGIVHRDLKPSNVLVTLLDGKPVPKVIDFGIVKSVGPRLSDKTVYTGFKAMMGTPTYMSPEQAEMSNAEVDTRSDIYSLGVLLYELLTGTTPFEGDRLRKAGLIEFRRILLEEEPPRPSNRVSTMNAQRVTTVAGHRRLEPARLASSLRGDLDWVVMKALDKDRGRRYPTAVALGEDVRRFVEGLPVEARPPSNLYRFSKFARRNKTVLATAGIVALALIVGTGVSLWQAAVARSALAKAQVSEAEADRSREELEGFTERLREATDLLGKGRVYVNVGNLPAAHDAYTSAVSVQPQYFPVWLERGSFYARLGLWERAADDYARARELDAPANGAEFFGGPQVFVLTGRRRESEAVRDELLAIGSGYNSSDLRNLLAGPLSREDAAMLAAVAEDLLAEKPDFGGPNFAGPGGRGPDGPERGGPERRGPGGPERGDRSRRGGLPRGVMLYLAGWAHLRAGDAERAIERLEQAGQDRNWEWSKIVRPLLATAYADAGRTDRAAEAYEESKAAMDGYLDEAFGRSQGTPSMPWFDWAEFLLHHRDASRRFGAETAETDVRLARLRSRTLEAIE